MVMIFYICGKEKQKQKEIDIYQEIKAQKHKKTLSSIKTIYAST